MLRSSKIGLAHLEEPDSPVGKPCHHRLDRKSNHAPVRENALRWNRSKIPLCVRWILRRESLCRFDLDVFRKRTDALDERPLVIKRAASCGEFRNVRGIERCDVDHRRAVGSIGLDFEHCDNRWISRLRYSMIDRQRGVGSQLERHASQQNLVSLALPSKNSLGEFVPAKGVSSRSAGKPANEQHVAIEFAARNLEEQRVAKTVSREQSDFRLRRFGYDLCVRFDAGFGIGFRDTVSAKLSRSFSRSRRWRTPDDKARLRTEQQRAGDEESAGISQKNSVCYDGEGFSVSPSMLTAMPME